MAECSGMGGRLLLLWLCAGLVGSAVRDEEDAEDCTLRLAISRDQFQSVCPARLHLDNFRKQLDDAKRSWSRERDDLTQALRAQEAATAQAQQHIHILQNQVAKLNQDVEELRQMCRQRPIPAAPAPPPTHAPTPSTTHAPTYPLSQPRAKVAANMQLEAQAGRHPAAPSHPITTADEARDCRGLKPAGVYMIQPDGAPQPFPVYCRDGWTYLTNRNDGSVSFLRNWEEYKHGFGDLLGEFYLGNEKIHQLTTQAKYRLRLDITPWNKTQAHATYREFSLSGESDLYRLHVGGHSGPLRNCLYRNDDSPFNHNEMAFSTYDRDNDNSAAANCALVYGSGNWFNDCYSSNLFGPHCGKRENHSKCAVWWDEKGRLILHQVSLRIRENRGAKDD